MRFTWLRPINFYSGSNRAFNIFASFGNSTNVVTDRGTAFASRDFEKFTEKQKIKHHKIAVASPWSNDVVERINRFVKSSLVKLCDTIDDWKNKLATIQYIINNKYHSVTKSPSKIIFRTKKPCRL